MQKKSFKNKIIAFSFSLVFLSIFCTNICFSNDKCELNPPGHPQNVLWFIISGSSDIFFLNDIESIWKTFNVIGYDPNLLNFILPKDYENEKSDLPEELFKIISFLNKKDFKTYFGKEGIPNKKIEKSGITSPDLIAIIIMSHGEIDGSIQWGNNSLNLNDLNNILNILHSTYATPIMLLLNSCFSGNALKLLDMLLKYEWVKDTYIIASSLSYQYTYAIYFEELWSNKDKIWPNINKIHCAKENIEEIFNENKLYNLTISTFLIGLLGVAPDSAGDGIDAQDLYNFINETSKILYQPPISFDKEYKHEITSKTYSDDSTSSTSFQSKFSFYIPQITVGISKNISPYIPKDIGEYLITSIVKSFENETKSYSNISIEECVSMEHCSTFFWQCLLNYNSNYGYQLQCINKFGLTIPSEISLSSEEFKKNITSVIKKIIESPWKISRKDIQQACIESKIPKSHVVLLDRSGSMKQNDPNNEKRRRFYDMIIRPLLEENKIIKLYVISFSDDIQYEVCFDKNDKGKSDLEFAFNCFLKHIKSNGLTNLIQSIKAMKEKISSQEKLITWILSDGIDTEVKGECEKEIPISFDSKSRNKKINNCISEKIKEAANIISSFKNNTIYSFYLKGQNDENGKGKEVIEEIALIRSEADKGRFLKLENNNSQLMGQLLNAISNDLTERYVKKDLNKVNENCVKGKNNIVECNVSYSFDKISNKEYLHLLFSSKYEHEFISFALKPYKKNNVSLNTTSFSCNQGDVRTNYGIIFNIECYQNEVIISWKINSNTLFKEIENWDLFLTYTITKKLKK